MAKPIVKFLIRKNAAPPAQGHGLRGVRGLSRPITPYDGPLLADGFEDALIGVGFQFNTPVAVYDRAQCLHILMTRDGMTEEDAEEYFSFNVVGAWMGRSTPVFIDRS